MKKLTKYSLIGLGALLLTFFLVFAVFLNSIVKSGIEHVGSDMMQTSVTVDDVSISLFSGKGTIRGFKVDNPEGFKKEHAVDIGSLDITVDITSLLSDEILINEIIITNPAFSVIQKVPQNNLMMLMKNMEEVEDSDATSPAMIVEYLLVKDGKISVSPNIGSDKQATVGMGTVELTDVGREENNSMVKTIRQISSQIIGEALRSALSGEMEDLKEGAKDAVKDLFN